MSYVNTFKFGQSAHFLVMFGTKKMQILDLENKKAFDLWSLEEDVLKKYGR